VTVVAVTQDAARKCPTCGRFFSSTERFCSRDATALELVEVQDARVGQVIAGRYRIQSLLSSGGMGVVYIAEQVSIGRNVALKLLRPDKLGDEVAGRRFEREALAISELASPHTVRVHDFGRTDEGELFMAMELLRGLTLRELLDQEGALALHQVRAILDPVARALSEAHAAGIVHRDLKPENVFLAASHDYPQFVKVLDFGIAATLTPEGTRLTRDSQLPGTPVYVAPERIAGEPVDPRSDVYALGIMAYEMLVGTPPFEGDTSWDVFTQHLESDAEPIGDLVPGLPPALASLIMRCLSKSPAARPRDAGAFRQMLAPRRPTGGTMATEPDTLRLPPATNTEPALSAPPTRESALWIGAVAALVVVGIAIAYFRQPAGDLPVPALQIQAVTGLDEAPQQPPRLRVSPKARLEPSPMPAAAAPATGTEPKEAAGVPDRPLSPKTVNKPRSRPSGKATPKARSDSSVDDYLD